MILVPYVGQLFRVQRCLEAAQLRLLVSERDREQMERAGGEAEGEEGGEGEGHGEDGDGGQGANAAAGKARCPALACAGIFTLQNGR